MQEIKGQPTVDIPTEDIKVKTILFPTDFSDAASNALEYALRLAQELGSKLKLVHIYPGSQMPESYPNPKIGDLLNENRVQDAIHQINSEQELIQKRLWLQVDVEIELVPGDPISEIIRMSKEVDLMVMGTSGILAREEKIFGSVAEKVLQRAICPVWLIPEGARYKSIRHIMFSLDFDEDSVAAGEALLNWAKLFDADLSFTHIHPIGDEYTSVEYSVLEALYKYGKNWQKIGFYNFPNRDIVTGLHQFAQENQVDLVAMLSHRRDLIGRLFGKSITRKVAAYSLVPLLIFHDE